MIPQTVENSCEQSSPTNLPQHFCYFHSGCSDNANTTQDDSGDTKTYRESVIRLPRDEIAKVITGIQECINDCLMDAELSSQRLKLLQDISWISGLLPRPYWISNITRGDMISGGGEATIYTGCHGTTAVVIREFHLPAGIPRAEHMKVIMREIIAHWQIRHHNIVELIGVHQFDKLPFPSMILQRAAHPSAIEYLRSHPAPQSFVKIVVGLVDGVYYLHTRSPPIIHGDLHDLNILVTCTGECLLCDFGLSRIRHEISRTYTTVHHGGRERFLAPEITHNAQENTRIDEPSDIYSLAMTVYALGTRSLPFADLKNIHAVCREAASGRRPSKHDSLGGLTTDDTEFLWSLLERMWDGRPEFRPTISHVRDEIMKSNLICLESATTPIAASSGNGQPSTSTASLQHPDRPSSQDLASGNKDQRISGPTVLPGGPFVPGVDESSDFKLLTRPLGWISRSRLRTWAPRLPVRFLWYRKSTIPPQESGMPTILLPASRSRTEQQEKNHIIDVEEPGMDALRGSFGTLGSVIRARSVRSMRSQSRGPSQQYRFGGHDAEERGGSNELTTQGLANLPRHQLYDAPVPQPTPPLPGVSEDNGASLAPLSTEHSTAQPAMSPRMQTIRFEPTQVAHYYPTTPGKGGAVHQQRHNTMSMSTQRGSQVPEYSDGEDEAFDPGAVPLAHTRGASERFLHYGLPERIFFDPFQSGSGDTAGSWATYPTSERASSPEETRRPSHNRPQAYPGGHESDEDDMARESLVAHDSGSTRGGMRLIPSRKV